MAGILKIRCLWAMSMVLIVASQLPYSNGQADNLGTEFVVVFMRNDVENPLESPLELFITTPNTIPVQVTISTPKRTQMPTDISVTVVSGQVEKVELSHLLRMTWTGIEGKVIYIQADDEIVVYGLNKEKFSTDGFLAYPIDVIGYEYYTVSHSPTNSNTEFAIASRYDDTIVTIEFPIRRLAIPIRVEYNGRTYTGGDQLTITLQAFEAFQCVSYDKADLTVSYITSNKPIAVFSGNIRTWVGESDSRDHLTIQLPPTQAYGKQFPIIPTPGRTVGDVIKVIAPTPGTNVKVASPGVTWLEGGMVSNYFSFIIPSENYTTISADHPILVVQISQSQQESLEPGDPTMLAVTATPQFAADYVFSTPKYSQGGSYENYLMCVAKASETDGLMFDGRPFSRLEPVWKPFPETDLVGTEVRIAEGAHVIKHTSPIAVFSGYVYGTADRESYSFQIGTRLAPINQPCVMTDSIFGDGVDNDCDGLIDEELCTKENRGTDTDLDSSIDEDCALTREIAEGAPDSGGKQFLIYFMENNVEAPRYLPLEVYVTPVRQQSVSVRIESPRWFEPSIREDATIALGSVKKFNIPYTMRERGTTMTSKALFITADADVVVYGVNKEIYSADAFLALPLDVLGQKYYAVTHWPNSDSSLCQLGVIGVHDGTRLEITFPESTGRGIINVEYDGVSYTNGDMMTLAINRYSTFQIQSKGDLSGTMVKSTQKVAVLSGNIRTAVGPGSSRDHLVAMLPPVDSWGKLYCTVPIPGRTTGDYFYVMASEDDTLVQITDRNNMTIDAGNSRMIIIQSNEYVAFKSNKPILLTQISQSQRTPHEIGDPTMIVLPSLEQWANAYTFSTTSRAFNDDNNMYNNYVVMVAPTNKTNGIIFDGQYMPPLFATWVQIRDTPHSGTSFAISNGVHTIQHEDATVTLSVVVYGNADKESYGFPAGMRLADINAPCETTFTIAGDGIDNDCDGRIDEELCEGEAFEIDDDSDGRFNEDCAIVVLPPEFQTTLSPPAVLTTTTPAPTTPWVIIGPPGPPGSQGRQGMPGAQGAPGSNGFPGQPGLNGLPGVDGSDGGTGATGVAGPKGENGGIGLRGPTGLTGVSGAIGPKGQAGSVGATGVKGERGLSIKGERGFVGVAGALGPTGSTGVKGEHGSKGSQGFTGSTGATGVTGVKGEHGAKGESGSGYIDINECNEGTDQCSDGCVNTIGSYYCTCPTGYILNNGGRQCTDEDECSENNGGCVDMCRNTIGSFTCSCELSGYHIAHDLKTCIDQDECSMGSHNCIAEQLCVNTMGSFVCLNQTKSNEMVTSTPPPPQPSGCAVNNGGCTDQCYDTEGGFYCSCQQTGYMLANNAQTCMDIDECEIGNHDCTIEGQMCVNSFGSYYCVNKTLPIAAPNPTTNAPKPAQTQRIRMVEGPNSNQWITAFIAGSIALLIALVVQAAVTSWLYRKLNRLEHPTKERSQSNISDDLSNNNNLQFPKHATRFPGSSSQI